MKKFFTSCFLFINMISFGQTYSGPESAEYDAAHNRWLIANTQSHQVLARDQSGTLSVFVGSLGSGPYGIEIVGDTLFCCSGSTVKGFSLSNGAPVFTKNTGATFLNGITHDLSGNLYVTDFSAKTIHKLNIASQSDTIIASSLIQSPNGILFDANGNRCVFVNWGSNAPIKAIDLSTFVVSTITATSLSSCDGITRDGQGRYYVSNWGSQSVVQFDSAFSTAPVTVVSGLNNPADIFYNIPDDTLAIPNAGNNTVTFFGFSTVGVETLPVFSDWLIYPNPSSSFAELKLKIRANENEQMNFLIVDHTGRRIETKKININQGENTIAIDGNLDLKPGIYHIRVYAKNSEAVFNWILE